MSRFSQNSCKTSLRIQYVSFRIYTIWYWLLWRMFAVCGWWHASSNISDIRNKYIVYVMFLSLHYLMSFRLFEKKSLNFKNTKTNFVRSSTNAGKTQQSYMACCNRWGKENIQNNRVRERNVKFFSRCMKMPALEWY